jgi:hypothetical protein
LPACLCGATSSIGRGREKILNEGRSLCQLIQADEPLRNAREVIAATHWRRLLFSLRSEHPIWLAKLDRCHRSIGFGHKVKRDNARLL